MKQINKEKVEIPDGEYVGLWSAYYMTIKVGDNEITFKTINGVRGINCKAKVRVVDKNVYLKN